MLYLGGEDKAGIQHISDTIVKTQKVFTTHAVAFKQSCYDAVIAELSKENEKILKEKAIKQNVTIEEYIKKVCIYDPWLKEYEG